MRMPFVYVIPDGLGPLPEEPVVALRFYSTVMEERVGTLNHRKFLRQVANMTDEELDGQDVHRKVLAARQAAEAATGGEQKEEQEQEVDPVEAALDECGPPNAIIEEALHAVGKAADGIQTEVLEGEQMPRARRFAYLEELTSKQARHLAVCLLKDSGQVKETKAQQGEDGAGSPPA